MDVNWVALAQMNLVLVAGWVATTWIREAYKERPAAQERPGVYQEHPVVNTVPREPPVCPPGEPPVCPPREPPGYPPPPYEGNRDTASAFWTLMVLLFCCLSHLPRRRRE